MKTKGSPKKSLPFDADRIDRKGAKIKVTTRDKGSKKRLSIYDDFNDEEELNQFEDNMDE